MKEIKPNGLVFSQVHQKKGVFLVPGQVKPEPHAPPGRGEVNNPRDIKRAESAESAATRITFAGVMVRCVVDDMSTVKNVT